MRPRPPLLFFAALLAACGTTPNPGRPDEPAPWPDAASRDAERHAAEGAAAEPETFTAPEEDAARAERPATASPAPGPRPPTRVPPATPAEREPDGESDERRPLVPIATIGGSAVDVSELLAAWLFEDSRGVKLLLDHVAFKRIVFAEATRLGVKLEPSLLEAAVDEEVAAREREIARTRAGVSLDEFVREVLDLDPELYRARLREELLGGLLAERVVRAWVLSSERSEVRVIVVDDEAARAEVQAALDAGRPFADVARERSTDPSAEQGGRLPPVMRGETVMSDLAYRTPVGTTSEPREVAGKWLFVHVEARPDPLEAEEWRDLGPLVEASLAGRPLEPIELEQWHTVMLRRYPVDFGPFLELAGEVRGG